MLEKITKPPKQDGTFDMTRLEDIDPEFVSLVPRGANKHSKMLIVKCDPSEALSSFIETADPRDEQTASIYAHLVTAALDAGIMVKYDENDALDKLLPADLVGRLTKGEDSPEDETEEGTTVVEPPAPVEPPMREWLSQARERATSGLIEAVLAIPTPVATVAKAAPVSKVDTAIEIAKAEAACLRAEVGRLRAAIGGSAALPAGEVPAFTAAQESVVIPWSADFAAVAAKQEKDR